MENQSLYISVAKDFSLTPGTRFKSEGPFSAEEFMETVLLPKFREARQKKCKLTIDLDGVEGYATSFLQGTFGNLAAEFGSTVVEETIIVISNDDPYLSSYIKRYIREAHRVAPDPVT